MTEVVWWWISVVLEFESVQIRQKPHSLHWCIVYTPYPGTTTQNRIHVSISFCRGVTLSISCRNCPRSCSCRRIQYCEWHPLCRLCLYPCRYRRRNVLCGRRCTPWRRSGVLLRHPWPSSTPRHLTNATHIIIIIYHHSHRRYSQCCTRRTCTCLTFRWQTISFKHSIRTTVGCGFLFALHSNYGSILHYLRDKARCWSKIVIFSYPLHSTSPLGGHRRNIAIPFGTGKLEWWGYLTVKKG